MFLVAANCFAVEVAVEWQRNDGVFDGFIGKLEIDIQSKAMAASVFAKSAHGGVQVYSHHFEILEIQETLEGHYRIGCRNEMGAMFSGHVDLSDSAKPAVKLYGPNNVVITNISRGGKWFKFWNIRNVYLGR